MLTNTTTSIPASRISSRIEHSLDSGTTPAIIACTGTRRKFGTRRRCRRRRAAWAASSVVSAMASTSPPPRRVSVGKRRSGLASNHPNPDQLRHDRKARAWHRQPRGGRVTASTHQALSTKPRAHAQCGDPPRWLLDPRDCRGTAGVATWCPDSNPVQFTRVHATEKRT
jgi:hypothetical protein